MNENEISKEKNVQKKFQPYQVLVRKRTKDVKSQTGPWPNFGGPFYTDIKHKGKVSLIISGSITLMSIIFLWNFSKEIQCELLQGPKLEWSTDATTSKLQTIPEKVPTDRVEIELQNEPGTQNGSPKTRDTFSLSDGERQNEMELIQERELKKLK